jgi:iron complex transport system substrate-binding protein
MAKSLLLILIPLILFLDSCQESTRENVPVVTLTDQEGTVLNIDQPLETIVSLTPSMTELLARIGLDSLIIGRSQNCDYPESILEVEMINTYPHLDIEKILSLSPDLVVTYQGITPNAEINKLRSLGLQVYVGKMSTLSDWNSCAKDLSALGHKNFTDTISSNIPLKEGARPTLIALCGVDPLYGFGTDSFQNSIFQAAGFKNILNNKFERYPRLNEESILSLDPNYLMVTGDDINILFSAHPNLKRCKAYKNGNVINCPTDLISRPGGRIEETIMYLAAYAE